MKKLFLIGIVTFLQGSFSLFAWQWTVGHEKHAIHFVEKGQGSNHVILLHGFCASTYTWQGQIDLLAKAGFHVWALDFIGFGKSYKSEKIPYHIDLLRDQVIAFMKEKKISSAHIVGHSMGGAVSLALATAKKDVVRSLVLVDAAGYPLKMPLFLTKYTGILLYPFVNETMLRLALKKLYFDSSKITEEQVKAYWQPLACNQAKWSAIKALGMFDNDLFSKKCVDYPKISSPTLVIWGEKDKLIPLSHCQHFIKDIRTSKAIIIAMSGHAPQEECPEQFNKALLPFLLEH